MPTVSTAVGRCKQNTKNSSTETEVPSVPRQTGSRGQGQVSRGKLRMGLGSGARLAPLPRLPGPHRDPRPPPSGKRRGPGPCPSCCGLRRWVPGARALARTQKPDGPPLPAWSSPAAGVAIWVYLVLLGSSWGMCGPVFVEEKWSKKPSSRGSS